MNWPGLGASERKQDAFVLGACFFSTTEGEDATLMRVTCTQGQERSLGYRLWKVEAAS